VQEDCPKVISTNFPCNWFVFEGFECINAFYVAPQVREMSAPLFKRRLKIDSGPFAEAEEWLGCFCLNGGIFEVLTQLGRMPGKPAPMATLGEDHSDEIAIICSFATHVLNKIHGPVFVVTLVRRAARPHSLTTLKAALGRLIFY
jgi:hypothetical protein